MSKLVLIFVIAFLITFILGFPIINFLKKRKYGQTILEYVEVHNSKQNTPTMGGVIFLLSTLITLLLFNESNSFLLWLSIIALFGFGLIGFLDDFIKIKFKRNLGLTPWQKIIGQGGLALLIGLFCYFSNLAFNSFVPFSFVEFNLGIFIIPIVCLVVIGTVNAVNLIDGLDGLCSKISCVYLIAFGIILLTFSQDLYMSGFSEIQVFEVQNLAKGSICLAGALLGFLVFNSNKASVFMGDVGSLAIGGFISCVGVFSGLWLYIPILGFLFVLTAISVILQVLYYKKTKKRIFLMAPLHHHFEKKGINESKIVSCYSILSIIISLICIYFTM